MVIDAFIWAAAAVTVAVLFTPFFLLLLIFLLLSLPQPAEFFRLFPFPPLLQFSPAFLVPFLPFADGVRFTVTLEESKDSFYPLTIGFRAGVDQCGWKSESGFTCRCRTKTKVLALPGLPLVSVHEALAPASLWSKRKRKNTKQHVVGFWVISDS